MVDSDSGLDGLENMQIETRLSCPWMTDQGQILFSSA